MNLRKGISDNMKLAIVATMVVAICLLASYVMSDDDRDGPEQRTVAELGDYVEFGLWKNGNGYDHVTIKLISIGDEDSTYLLTVEGKEIEHLTVDKEFLENMTYFDGAEGYTKTGEVYITTVNGDILCDLYEDDDSKLYVHDGLMVKMVLPSTTIVMYHSSLTEPEAPAKTVARTQPTVGDYFATKTVSDGRWIVEIRTVDSIEDNGYGYILQEYMHGPHGSAKISGGGIIAVERLLYLFDDAEGWTTDGRIECLPTAMGDVLCRVYSNGEGDRKWVGTVDNIVYRYESADGEEVRTVIGYSLGSDEPVQFSKGGYKDVEVGDYICLNNYTFRVTESGYFLNNLSIYGMLVTDVTETEVVTDVLHFIEEESTEVRMPLDEYGSRIDTSTIEDISEVSVVKTVMGDRLCITGEWNLPAGTSVTGSHISVVVDVETDVVFITSLTSNGSRTVVSLSKTSEIGNTREDVDVRFGDMALYVASTPDGDGFMEAYTIHMVEGGPIFMYASDDTFKNGRFDWEGYEAVGEETLFSIFGNVECTVYESESDDGITLRIWMSDCSAFPVKYMFSGPEGTYTSLLLNTSFA